MSSDIDFLLRVYKRALGRAYGMGSHEAFIAFKKGKLTSDGSLIKNEDAYGIAEAMRKDARELALWAEEKLRQV